jgi:hypothetical protein
LGLGLGLAFPPFPFADDVSPPAFPSSTSAAAGPPPWQSKILSHYRYT